MAVFCCCVWISWLTDGQAGFHVGLPFAVSARVHGALEACGHTERSITLSCRGFGCSRSNSRRAETQSHTQTLVIQQVVVQLKNVTSNKVMMSFYNAALFSLHLLYSSLKKWNARQHNCNEIDELAYIRPPIFPQFHDCWIQCKIHSHIFSILQNNRKKNYIIL